MPNFIPGLTLEHFKCGSKNRAPTPSLKTGSRVHPRTGDFHFVWTARGPNYSSYRVSAKGNIYENGKSHGAQQWWGFKCSCSCPDNDRRVVETLQNDQRELIVCEHLYAALSSVLDPTAKPAVVDNEDVIVPGLTIKHFIKFGAGHNGSEPILIKADVDKDGGEFHVKWEITGTRGKNYKLSASGNILEDGATSHRCSKWWGFQTHCSCSNYWEAS
jgi:hypothetical protein